MTAALSASLLHQYSISLASENSSPLWIEHPVVVPHFSKSRGFRGTFGGAVEASSLVIGPFGHRPISESPCVGLVFIVASEEAVVVIHSTHLQTNLPLGPLVSSNHLAFAPHQSMATMIQVVILLQYHYL